MVSFTQDLNLPIRSGPVRFAIGPPDGVTSNSWKCWTQKSGVYIVCRDNFRETKVSLHTSGKWRMGFTEEATKKNPQLVPLNQDRVWRKWDEPAAQLPNLVLAFRLLFPTSELAVLQSQRKPTDWKEVIFIEAAPLNSGKLVAVSLFITKGDIQPVPESEPSLWLASLQMADGRRAQLVAHGEPEADLPQLIDQALKEAKSRAEMAGVKLHPVHMPTFSERIPRGGGL